MLVDGVTAASAKRDRVRVLAQGRRCVGVTEAGLGLQDLATFDQERGDVVTQPMQSRSFHT